MGTLELEGNLRMDREAWMQYFKTMWEQIGSQYVSCWNMPDSYLLVELDTSNLTGKIAGAGGTPKKDITMLAYFDVML